jgi:hypothetical protein
MICPQVGKVDFTILNKFKLILQLFYQTKGFECQDACQQNPACTNFQYQKFTGNCELKNASTGPRTTDTTMLTGPSKCDYIKSNYALCTNYYYNF